MLEWDDLRFVLAIARHGSLTAAARSVGVTQPTMGRRLEKLEARLGVRLFERTVSGLALNVLGTSLIPLAEQMEQSGLAAERRIAARDTGLEGVIYVTTVEWLGRHLLAPLFASFIREHPRTTIQLVTAEHYLSLARHETEIALRPTRFEQEDLVQRRIGGLPRALYASHDYLTDRGEPNYAAGCPGHMLITLLDSMSALPHRRWLCEHLAPRAHIAVQSNSIDVHVEVALAGAGLVLLPCLMADGLSGLCRLQPPEPPPVRELWLGFHEDLRHTRRVHALVDHIAAGVRKRLLEGGRSGVRAPDQYGEAVA